MNYEIFISYKHLDEQGNKTPDLTIAQELHNTLINMGYKAFFSAVSLGKIGSSQFKADIDDALDTSKIMIVVLTNADYALSKWVKYEWDSFYSDYLNGIRKEPNLFTLTLNVNIHSLPRTLRSVQNFDYREGLSNLCEYIKNVLPLKAETIITNLEKSPQNIAKSISLIQPEIIRKNDDIKLCGICTIKKGVAVGYECLGKDDNLVIPNGVTKIGYGAFSSDYDKFDPYCIKSGEIKKIDIPDTVTEIEAFAFEESLLNEITIPNSVTKIGAFAFYNCDELESVILSNKITNIDRGLFDQCSKLKKIVIPDRVIDIGESAFAGTAIEEIIIPEGVLNIGHCSFMCCESLTKITIPNSVMSIGVEALAGCKSLSLIIYKGSEYEWNNVKKYQNWDEDTGDYKIVFLKK